MNKTHSLIVLIVFIIVICVIFIVSNKNKKKEKIFHNFENNEKSLIILILGQSNAANYGSHLFSSDKNIYNYYENKIFIAKDPLKGASGNKGSIWIPMSEKLISDGGYKQILLVSIAEGGSTVSDWNTKGKYYKKLINTLTQLKNNNLFPNYILWQQGEEDNLLNTSLMDYKDGLQEIIGSINKLLKKNTPFILSLTSYSPTAITPVNNEIRKAQMAIVNSNKNVFIGPNTDKYIENKYRYDGIHLSKQAMIKIANDWSEILLKIK